MLDTIRQHGPVTIKQIVNICGSLIKPEIARRKALAYSTTSVARIGRLHAMTVSEQIEDGRRIHITDVVVKLHDSDKIKRLGGVAKTKSSEWVVSEWSVLDKEGDDVTTC